MAYVHVTCKPMQVYTYPRVNYVVIETEEVKAADSFLEAFLYGGLKRDIKEGDRLLSLVCRTLRFCILNVGPDSAYV